MFSGKFSYVTKLPIQKSKAWDFFNDINNLVRITSFPKVSINKHAGTIKGSETQLSLDFLIFRKKWNLIYLEVEEGEFFTDKSDSVPFPFVYWEHTHAFEEVDGNTVMTDTVTYKAYVPSFFAKSILYIMFKGREQAIRKHLLS